MMDPMGMSLAMGAMGFNPQMAYIMAMNSGQPGNPIWMGQGYGGMDGMIPVYRGMTGIGQQGFGGMNLGQGYNQVYNGVGGMGQPGFNGTEGMNQIGHGFAAVGRFDPTGQGYNGMEPVAQGYEMDGQGQNGMGWQGQWHQ